MTRLLDNHSGPYALPDDLRVAVKVGAIPGYEYKRKFGRNPDIDSGTSPEDVWPNGGIRILPTVAGVGTLVSTSANDAAAGTGGRTVKVQGLDANYLEIEETVTLNGTTPVNTTAEFLRINRMFVDDAGVLEFNDGIISATVGGNVQATIDVNDGQTTQLMDTVPAGKVLIITDLVCVSGRQGTGQDVKFFIQTRSSQPGKSWRVRYVTDCYQTDVPSTLMLRAGARTDIRVQTSVSSGSNVNLSGYWTGYLINSPLVPEDDE